MSVKKLCFSVCIYRVRSILLLSINFLSINKIVSMSLWHNISWQDPTWLLIISLVPVLRINNMVFMEAHSHWRGLIRLPYNASHSTNIMWVVIHFKDLLLLSS